MSTAREGPMNDLDFRNRTAVITGGAAGIGLAVARRLAASGAAVALWDRDARRSRRRARSSAARTRKPSTSPTAPRWRARPTPPSAGAHRRARLLGRHHRPERHDVGISGRRVAAGDGRQRQRPFLLQSRRRARDARRTTTGASSTSHRSRARKATRTRRPTARRKPRSSGSRNRSARSSRRPASASIA